MKLLQSEQIEKKVLFTVSRVMYSSTLEEQRVKTKVYRAMLTKTKEEISDTKII